MGTDGGTATGDGGGPTCPAPSMTCLDPTGKPYCANVQFDQYNCGTCGRICAANQVCQNGGCVLSGSTDGGTPPPPNCPANLKACVPAAGGGYCADIVNDTNNCGVCFNVCSAGFFCQNATCVPQGTGTDGGTAIKCVAPQVSCDGTYCADFATDRGNCGGCHLSCAATEFCSQGVCTPG
jgi:hypothetical protein